MKTRIKKLILWWCLIIVPSIPLNATENDAIKTFVVGVENIDYFPHHAIKRADRGAAFVILNLFAQQMGYELLYQAHPIRRLRTNLITHQSIDFSYPDHPNWSPEIKGEAAVYYSDPVVHIVSGTVVPKNIDEPALEKIKTLAVIRGFTPTLWEGKLNGVRILEVSDAQSALKMVLLGRADGTDMELSVANYHLSEMSARRSLVMSKSLASTRFPFHLSTVKQPKVLEQFNQFLRDNVEQINAINHEYHILETLK